MLDVVGIREVVAEGVSTKLLVLYLMSISHAAKG